MGLYDSERFRKVCKYGLIAANTLSFFAGFALIGAGIYLLVYKADLLSYVYMINLIRPADCIIIAVGAGCLIVPFLGLIGALRENSIVLIIYIVIAGLVACLAVIGAVLAIISKNPYNGYDFIRQQMRQTLQSNYGVDVGNNSYNAFITAMWDLAQQNWYCCGAEDSSWGIYRQSIWYANQPGEKEYTRPMVPPSCCMKDQYGRYINLQKCQTWQDGPPKLASGPIMNEALFYDGCYVYGSHLIQNVAGGVIAMGIAVAILLGTCVLFAIGLVIFNFKVKGRGGSPVNGSQKNFSSMMYSASAPSYSPSAPPPKKSSYA